jgi:hypothetical protein
MTPELTISLVGVSLIFFGTIVTAVFSYLAHKNAAEVNDAVNHRHLRGSNAPKLYDAVLDTSERLTRVEAKVDGLTEWKHSYDASPLNTGDGVCKFLDEFEKVKSSINWSCDCDEQEKVEDEN